MRMADSRDALHDQAAVTLLWCVNQLMVQAKVWLSPRACVSGWWGGKDWGSGRARHVAVAAPECSRQFGASSSLGCPASCMHGVAVSSSNQT
jgi:hypothetical protein